MERTNKRIKKPKQNEWWLNPLINGGIGLTVLLAAVLVSPLILIKTDDPNSMTFIAAAVCTLLGSIVSGILNGIQAENKDIIPSLISAAVIVLPIVLISFFYESKFNIIEFAIIMGVILLASVLPTIIMGNIKGNNKRNMKKVMKRR